MQTLLWLAIMSSIQAVLGQNNDDNECQGREGDEDKEDDTEYVGVYVDDGRDERGELVGQRIDGKWIVLDVVQHVVANAGAYSFIETPG